MRKIIKLTSRKPILGNDLLERWPGIASCVLAEMIDAKNADNTDTEPEKKILDFPRVYILVADLLRDPETQKIHARCVACKPDYKNGEKYTRPYKRLPKGVYDFSELIFRPTEVKAYEKLYPEVSWERVNPEDTPLARNSKQKRDIRKLQYKIDEIKKKNLDLLLQVHSLQKQLSTFMPSSTELVEANINKWQEYYAKLDDSDKKGKKGRAARMAMLKFGEKSHIEVYCEVYGPKSGRSDNAMMKSVSAYKKFVEELALENGLEVPTWDTRK